ncbi:chemotaxis protein CheW [Ramlibacter sp. AN1015]|uniref:chemotaxis protein CheW n=1 Tax=Ramlibacter sp. AN1015 TaxID=3133428 RepID=UPI0030BD0980
MANRDALRELQARLAGRLQAARTDDVQAAWLAVVAAQAHYLFPLAQSGEIFPFAPLQRVPYTQPWFLGVANLRGGLWGVVDLCGLLGGERPPRAAADASRAQSRLVALNPMLEVNCAFLIDRLAGLRSLDAFTVSHPPAPDAPAWFGSVYTDPQGTRWQELNLQALSRQPQFLSISV